MNAWALAAAFARRELRGGIRGFRVFLACLLLGVAVIAAVGSLAAGVREAIEADARLLLGGDVELSFTHRHATPEQLAAMAESGAVSTVVEMRAMARTAQQRALVELKAVDGAYPLIGAILLARRANADTDLQAALAQRDGAWGAALERATMVRLGVAIGDTIRIGDADFQVRAEIEAEPDRTTNPITLGPRVMIGAAALPDTGLIQLGSLIRYGYRIRLARAADATAFAEAIKARFPDAGWRVRMITEAAPGLQRWIDRIAMFLTLVGLTALLVGGVGVANAVRNYLDGKRATIAIFKCLGAPGPLTLRIYFVQIMVLAVVGVVAGLAIGAAVPLLAGPLVAAQIGVAVRAGIYPGPLLLAASFGLLTAFAFSLWPLARAREIPPAALFRDLVAPERRWPRPSYVAATALAAVLLAVLTVASSIDRKIALGFVAASAVTFVLFLAAGWAIAAAARSATRVRHPGLRLALANMHRPGSPTGGIVMSLGIGLTVLVVITQIHGNFARELREQLPQIAPTFFFIDIQPDQVETFDRIMTTTPGVTQFRRVPSLRGRITRLNGVPVNEARMEPGVRWAVGSDRGLTYSPTPPEGTRIAAGEWWPADYNGPPLVSFDAGLAAGMGLSVGDTMTFNVLGIEVEARIANLRWINWTNLGINFTTIFAPGTLEGAPQTWIATASSGQAAEDEIERRVTDAMANASTIRVRNALATIDSMLSMISDAAGVTAGLTLVAGTLVLAGAMAASQRKRIYDAVVLKVLGARRRDVIAAFLIEFGLIGLLAALIAAAIGTVCAYLLWDAYLRGRFVFMPWSVVAIALFAVVLVGGLGLAGTWRALGQKSAPVLRNA